MTLRVRNELTIETGLAEKLTIRQCWFPSCVRKLTPNPIRELFVRETL